MRLRELIGPLALPEPAGSPPRPAENPEITGLCLDSRRVAVGDLYVAIVGEVFDGRDFVPQAVARGAAAVLGPGPAPAGLAVPWIAVDEPRRRLGTVAARLYGQPHEELVMVGVTGTNGKTTVSLLLEQILAADGLATGVLGTLGYRLGERAFGDHTESDAGNAVGNDAGIAVGEDADHATRSHHMTTPEAPELFRTLAAMHRAGARGLVMEVSSHGLAMGRVSGARFDAAVFTNLTQDHLDFHGDMESYFQAKKGLFELLRPGGKAVIHVGDDYGRRLAAEVPEALTYAIAEESAAVSVRQAELSLVGIRAAISTPRGEIEIRSALLGGFNLENILSAVATAEALGIGVDAITVGVARQRPLNGRLEPVDAGQRFPALVDFAHTPGALEALLRSFRDLTDRKISLVFGCSGGRDQGKRRLMGRIAGRGADLPVATSDNPRAEDPLEILAEIEEGLKESGNQSYRMMPDRRQAIHHAVAAVRESDEWALLVAGKGHEEIQILADRTQPFSDRDEIAAAIAAHDLATQETVAREIADG